MEIKERFKYINFQIAFLTEQLKEETDEDIIKYISSKIKEYERESKEITTKLMQIRYKKIFIRKM